MEEVEVDLFRAVQTLPGVSTLSDYSSGLYVRGGGLAVFASACRATYRVRVVE
ncbi:MAG: hypothetical protein KAW17_03455 [Candidatus Eisenbacteria sp.]|nr:hypothetical protein [Candidatus Eisenbacteria bacterium]